MLKILRVHGLTLTLLALFVFSLVGVVLTGHASFHQELVQHGRAALSLSRYLASGNFLSALFENWESEFLQMAVFVVLTAVLFQRGSAESNDADQPRRKGDRLVWHARYRVAAWFYSHSPGLLLIALFIGSFALHWQFSVVAANQDALQHGAEVQSAVTYLYDARLWFESFQNWQSEFLSTVLLVILSVFLRQRGSPGSKPVAAPDSQTGE